MPARKPTAGAARHKRKPEAFMKMGVRAGDRREARSDRDARACKRAKRMEIEAAELAGQRRLEHLRRLRDRYAIGLRVQSVGAFLSLLRESGVDLPASLLDLVFRYWTLSRKEAKVACNELVDEIKNELGLKQCLVQTSYEQDSDLSVNVVFVHSLVLDMCRYYSLTNPTRSAAIFQEIDSSIQLVMTTHGDFHFEPPIRPLSEPEPRLFLLLKPLPLDAVGAHFEEISVCIAQKSQEILDRARRVHLVSVERTWIKETIGFHEVYDSNVLRDSLHVRSPEPWVLDLYRYSTLDDWARSAPDSRGRFLRCIQNGIRLYDLWVQDAYLHSTFPRYNKDSCRVVVCGQTTLIDLATFLLDNHEKCQTHASRMLDLYRSNKNVLADIQRHCPWFWLKRPPWYKFYENVKTIAKCLAVIHLSASRLGGLLHFPTEEDGHHIHDFHLSPRFVSTYIQTHPNSVVRVVCFLTLHV